MSAAVLDRAVPARPVRVPPRRVLPDRRLLTIAVAAVAAVAFTVRLVLLVRGGGLLGDTGYDDGVYYSAADALIHGRLPYRDFLLLHPPGVLLALAPFAGLGSVTADPVGVGAARLVFVGIGALNAVLVLLAARRFGRTAAIVAGGIYAVFAPAVFAERSTVLEPLGTCAMLGSALLAAHAWRRPALGAALAGLVGGLGAGVKIWYVVPVLVLAAFSAGRRLATVAGAVAGCALVCVPFAFAAPDAMLREVVLDQLGRPRVPGAHLGRLVGIVGVTRLHLPGPLLTPHKVGAVLLLAVLVVALAALSVRRARVWPAQAAAAGAVLLAGPSYFAHYAAFPAPAIAVTTGIGVARLARLLPRRRLRALLAIVVIAVVGALGATDLRAVRSRPIPAGVLAAAASARDGCVVTDVPGVLAAMDVLSRQLEAGCPFRPDLTGWIYDADSEDTPDVHVPRTRNERWQQDATAYLTSGSSVLLHRPDTGLDRDSKELVTGGPVLARTGSWVLHAVAR